MQAKDSVLITEGGAGEMLMAWEAVHVGGERYTGSLLNCAVNLQLL